ncbi:hypothetical protein JCM10296v2_003479 [Rhodotorula toruloides]
MSSPLSSCAVCGTPTTSRCSCCANAGGPSIFFCSPKHQKLVWHNHKFVCREKSAQFIAPPLTKAELARVEEIADVKLPPHSQLFAYSVEDFGDGSTPMSGFFERLISGLGAGNCRRVLLPRLSSVNTTSSPDDQKLLHHIRVNAGAYRHATLDPPGMDSRLEDRSVWHFVAQTANAVYLRYPYLSGGQTLVRFRHRMLILFTLTRLRQNSDAQAVPDQWIFNSLQHGFMSLKDDGVLYNPLFVRQDVEIVRKICAWIQQVIDFDVCTEFVPGEGLNVRFVQ